jgi:amidohydrolase
MVASRLLKSLGCSKECFMTTRPSIRVTSLAPLVLACLAWPCFAADARAPSKPLPQKLLSQVKSSVDADTARLVAIFKDLHAHPEIAFTEARTAAIVSRELKALGYEVTEPIAQTGVVAVLKNGAGSTVWYRADMDAIQVKEATGLAWAPQGPQRLADGTEIDVMHGCGHDAHVTWLLGVARFMAQNRNLWSGTLVLYAQPAEEVGLGAQAMVDDKLWERGFPKPDYAFGMHTAPGPVGYVSSSPGKRMAGTDQLDIVFRGRGGHGSTPELTIDPVVMAAQAVNSYQTIISRNVDPQAAAVVTVGAVQAGTSNNVIPETAELMLNLRWFTRDVRDQMIRRIDEINAGIAQAAGVSADRMPTRTMKGTAGPVINDEALVAHINPSLTALLGHDQVIDQFPAVMGSEDFQEAFAPLGTPYAFVLVGIANPAVFAKARAEGRAFPFSNHSPVFEVDLDSIPVGAKVGTTAVLSLLAK